MKSKATNKVVTNNTITTTKAKVKNNIFGKQVVKIKKTVDTYAPTANGGRVFQGSKTTKTKRVYK
jgi:hypothetical protein